MTTLLMAGLILAGRPLLPAGKGGLILIAGGLVMVSVSMLWLAMVPKSLLAQSQRPPAATDRPRATRPARRRPARPPASTPSAFRWPVYIASEAERRGCRHAEVVDCDGRLCHIRVDHDRHGCRRERKALRRAARKVSKRAHVHEVRRGPTCLYEVRIGGR